MLKHIGLKRFSQPDETRSFTDKGFAEILKFGELTVGRIVLEPGWRWSTHVKPIVGTSSCQAAHTNYVLSGRLHIATDDGEEIDCGPGDVMVIPPGHDAWTVGDEPCVVLDFSGMKEYARAQVQAEQAPPPLH